MAFRFGSVIQRVSALAEQFRAENLSEPAIFTSGGVGRIVHVSSVSLRAGRYDIAEFGMFDEQAVFVGFTREFMASTGMDFLGWLWKRDRSFGEFRPPVRDDTLTIRSVVGPQTYVVTSIKSNPCWMFPDDDPGRRTFLLNTRRRRG